MSLPNELLEPLEDVPDCLGLDYWQSCPCRVCDQIRYDHWLDEQYQDMVEHRQYHYGGD